MQENEHDSATEPKSAATPLTPETFVDSSASQASTSKRIFQGERRTQRVLRECIIKIKQGDVHGLTVQDIYELSQCHKTLAQSSAPDVRLKTLVDETVQLLLAKVSEIQQKRVQGFVHQCWPEPEGH